jgi:hypothetical protein
LNLGIYGDRSGGSCGVTRRILHLDGLIAAETAGMRRIAMLAGENS